MFLQALPRNGETALRPTDILKGAAWPGRRLRAFQGTRRGVFFGVLKLPDVTTAIAALFRAELGEEMAAELPTLRRIPSTLVVRFIDYLTALAAPEQATLLDALASAVATAIASPQAGALTQSQHPALAQLNAALAFRGFNGGFRYTPIKILSGIAKNKAIGGVDGWLRNLQCSELEMRPRDDLLPPPYSVEPVKPARLKRLVDKALEALLAPERTKFGSELTQYVGVWEGWKVTVKVLFAPGGRVNPRQLEYIVSVASADAAKSVPEGGGTYEGMWWLRATWDYITEENAERSVAALKDLIIYLTRLTEPLNVARLRRT